MAGNDPASSVWKTEALPLDDTRLTNYLIFKEQKEKAGIFRSRPLENYSQIAEIYGAPRAVILTVPIAFVFATKWNLRIIE